MLLGKAGKVHALKRHIFTHMYRRHKIQSNKHVSKRQVVTEARRKQGYVCVGACVCVCVSVYARTCSGEEYQGRVWGEAMLSHPG